MIEIAIPYQLIGPDGTRVVVGNSAAAQADPDWIGLLDPENGITGLLDSADVRESASDLVELDGGSHGPFFRSRRSGTIQGVIDPNAAIETAHAYASRLKRATRALREDLEMRWTPSGSSLERRLLLRRQGRVAITGRRPKAFQVPLVSADHRILSASLAQLETTPDQTAAIIGFTQVTSPLSTTVQTVAALMVVNQGDEETWPRFRITGPITNPEVLNNTTGKRIRFATTLLAGEFLDIRPERAVVLYNGTADRYGAYDFGQSDWWQLQPGANDVRLLAAAYQAGAKLTVYWRHAWE